MLTISNAQAATLTIPVSETAGFDLFTTDFGVDAANGDAAASARFQFYADGTLLEEKTVKGSDFHGKFEISLADVAEIKISVFGKEGTCVSFGDAAFYKSSPNAVSMRVGKRRLRRLARARSAQRQSVRRRLEDREYGI